MVSRPHKSPITTASRNATLLTYLMEKTRYSRCCQSDERRMGRYKDYDRAPKRGGYDDDQTSDDRTSGVRPNYPSPSAPRASGSVEAIVKWFNAEKGFGFVAVVGGSEAFMHIRQLEAAGHSSVPEGALVKVRIGQGQKGPEVTEVIEVDTSAAQVSSTTA